MATSRSTKPTCSPTASCATIPTTTATAAARVRAAQTNAPGTVAASTIAAALGFGLLDDASDDVVGLLQSFAAGAVLVMLVDEMIPTALKQGGREAGLVATLGFALAYLLSTL